jgi:hypothetical protein
MIKIHYPADRHAFEEKYRKIFPDKLRDEFDKFRKKTKVLRLPQLDTILTANFADLCELSFDIQTQVPCSSKCTSNEKDPACLRCHLNSDLKSILNYDSPIKGRFQKGPDIAKFFKSHHQQLNLSTCYFCNISYIHAFENRGDYADLLDFVNTAPSDELEQITGIGEKSRLKLEMARPIRRASEIPFGPTKRLSFEKGFADYTQKKKLFTLDHLLNKASHPIAALSLYNLVPCCYSCNSQFKGSKTIVTKPQDSHLSPTSENFDMHTHFRFSLRFDKHAEVTSTTDFHLRPEFDLHETERSNYVAVFRLLSRYRKHKSLVLDLINKQKKYNPSHIKSIAQTVKLSEAQVRRDIFGAELYGGKAEQKPFTKFMRDIAQDIKMPNAIPSDREY